MLAQTPSPRARLPWSSITLFLALILCFSYFFPRWADWNVNSRLDLVVSIVDDHTLTIDRLVANTGDYADYNGHYYSDKAPGIALLAVPVYVALERLLPRSIASQGRVAAGNGSALSGTLRKGGTGLEPDKIWMFLALTVTTFVVAAIPAAVLGLLLFNVAGHLGLSRRESFAATILYTLGTSAFPYANSLVGHQTSAFFLFASFAILFAIRRGALGHGWCFVAGFLIGYAAIAEYQTALVGAILGFYGLLTLGRWPSTVGRLVVGAIPAFLLLGAYDLAAFGTILPVGYLHSALWADVHQVGFISLTYPHADALLGITFGDYRGLFFLSPYLLFASPGYFLLWRDRAHRPEFWVLLLTSAAFLLFNSSSAMWQGGFAVGPRYLVPALPFVALAAGVGIVWGWRHRLLRPLVVLASAWSLVAVWVETIGGQSFPDYTSSPLFNYSLPKLASGDIARNVGMVLGLSGWASLVPLLVVVVVLFSLANGGVTPPVVEERRPLPVGRVERWT